MVAIIQTVVSCAGSLQLRLRRVTDSLMQNIAILHLALENERDREEAVSPPLSLEQLRSASSAEFITAEVVASAGAYLAAACAPPPAPLPSAVFPTDSDS